MLFDKYKSKPASTCGPTTCFFSEINHKQNFLGQKLCIVWPCETWCNDYRKRCIHEFIISTLGLRFYLVHHNQFSHIESEKNYFSVKYDCLLKFWSVTWLTKYSLKNTQVPRDKQWMLACKRQHWSTKFQTIILWRLHNPRQNVQVQTKLIIINKKMSKSQAFNY